MRLFSRSLEVLLLFSAVLLPLTARANAPAAPAAPLSAGGVRHLDAQLAFIAAIEAAEKTDWEVARSSLTAQKLPPFVGGHFVAPFAANPDLPPAAMRIVKAPAPLDAAQQLLATYGVSFQKTKKPPTLQVLPPDKDHAKSAQRLARLADFLAKQPVPVRLVFDPAIAQSNSEFLTWDRDARTLYLSAAALLDAPAWNIAFLHELTHALYDIKLERGEDSLFYGSAEPVEVLATATRTEHLTHATEGPGLADTVERLARRFFLLVEAGDATVEAKQEASTVLQEMLEKAKQTSGALHAVYAAAARNPKALRVVYGPVPPPEYAVPTPGFALFVTRAAGTHDVYVRVKAETTPEGPVSVETLRERAAEKLVRITKALQWMNKSEVALLDTLATYHRLLAQAPHAADLDMSSAVRFLGSAQEARTLMRGADSATTPAAFAGLFTHRTPATMEKFSLTRKAAAAAASDDEFF